MHRFMTTVSPPPQPTAWPPRTRSQAATTAPGTDGDRFASNLPCFLDLPRRGRGGGVVLPQAEVVPLGVPAGREPAHARHRARVVRLATEFLHARGAGVDVVHVEVGANPALAGLHVGDRRARLVADSGHVVLERAGEGLELPLEERAPELTPLGGVVRRDLEVHRLAGHSDSSRIDGSAEPW